MLVPHDFADSTGFDMHISQATIDPLFSFPSPLSFLFLIRSYFEKHSRGIEFKEILRVQDGIVSHNIRRDSLDLKSYLFREVAHFVLSQQGPVVVPAVSKLLQHPSYTINSRWWKVGGCENSDAGNWQIHSLPARLIFDTFSTRNSAQHPPETDVFAVANIIISTMSRGVSSYPRNRLTYFSRRRKPTNSSILEIHPRKKKQLKRLQTNKQAIAV